MLRGQHIKEEEERSVVRCERPFADIGLLVLDEPSRRNCLSSKTLLDLKGKIGKFGQDKTVKTIVLAAEGPTFCSGHDLHELRAHRADKDGGREFYFQTMQLCSDVMQSIIACPQPVIAAVQGTATAAGCQIVATCDLAIADESALFSTPGVNIGLFCSTPMVALTRNIPRKQAMEMLLLGDLITAEEAKEFGLINRISPKGRAREAAFEMALKISSKSSQVIKMGKAAFYRQIEEPLHTAYSDAVKVMVENMLEADAHEGIDAFLNKRKAIWKGMASS